jgi:hypothetical protein
MIGKSARRFSEKIMLKTITEAQNRFQIREAGKGIRRGNAS